MLNSLVSRLDDKLLKRNLSNIEKGYVDKKDAQHYINRNIKFMNTKMRHQRELIRKYEEQIISPAKAFELAVTRLSEKEIIPINKKNRSPY